MQKLPLISTLACRDDSPTDPQPQPAFSVSAITPTGGKAGGGTLVTIRGTGFQAPMTVAFGGIPATGIHVPAHTTITLLAPTHAEGEVELGVRNIAGETRTLSARFTYDPDAFDDGAGDWDS